MNTKQNSAVQRRGLIAKIHIAKTQLGLDDDTYRTILLNITQLKSCAQMSLVQLEAVYKNMQRLGFKAKSPAKAGRNRPNVISRRETVLRKIEALLAEASRPWAYADNTAKQMFAIERVEWLADEQLYKLMQALIIDAARQVKA